MASSSGASSGSSLLQNSGSDEDLQQIMDQRKRKRMISNRESARRSRMKKQKHLDCLTAELTHLRNENNQIINSMGVTTKHYLTAEAENSVLRAQFDELTHRLQSLNEIISFMSGSATNTEFGTELYDVTESADMLFITNPWNYLSANQPIMASADMFMY